MLSAAFGVRPPEETVYDYASFVLAGAFGSNISAFVERNPRVILDLLKFRETQEGTALRKEIGQRLETNDSNQFSAAIEGGLKRPLRPSVLQSAHNRASEFMKAPHDKASASALWTDSQNDDASIRLWRDFARGKLLAEAKARGVESDSQCLCGSGDRLRDCCLRPLR